MQLGVSRYVPTNSNYFDYKDKESIINLIHDSDLVITHGGYGTMMDAIGMGKKIIAVPRKLEFGECLDNQEELVRYFDEKNYVVGCYNISDLPDLVDQCLQDKISFANYKPESSLKISDLIEKKLTGYFKNE
jgi:UDP-N-acetylglucosamine transferase subunit ALG13